MTSTPRPRRILHVDLDPFFVSVERSLDSALRGRPVIVGGDAASDGIVAAASDEARRLGVRPGQPLPAARRLCPQAVFRPGDLEAYARVSEEVTAILLSASRRVERPSTDEAYVDLTPESPRAPQPVPAAEHIKDEIQRRLRLDASLGLASSRLAARVASRGARPRGLLVVLPGYESRFLERQAISCLPDLPPHLEAALQRTGIETLGQVLAAEDDVLAAAAGPAAVARLREAARGEGEEAVAVAAPPAWILEEAVIRSRRADRESLLEVLEGLAARAARRLRPFELRAGAVSVEVLRGSNGLRRSEEMVPAVADEETLRQVTRALAEPLLDPPASVRTLQVRLARLAGPTAQGALFPAAGHLAPTSSRL